MASGQAAQPAPVYPRFLPVGDAALTVEFGNAITPEVNEAVVALDIALAAAELDGIVETVPSYRSLLVCYEPSEISFRRLVTELKRLLSRGDRTRHSVSAAWTVPVVYDPPYAQDLTEVAERLALTEQQVITIHSEADRKCTRSGLRRACLTSADCRPRCKSRAGKRPDPAFRPALL